jgi:hypothetical protein
VLGSRAWESYLIAVHGLVAVWSAEGREVQRARRTLRLQRLKVSDREGPFAAVIRCTADPVKADKRTRSKWSRVMRYAAIYKSDSEALAQFIKRNGGINTCKIDYPDPILNRRLSVEECLQAVDECGAPMVAIPGGEPLIHRNIGEIVKGIVARRKFVSLCTNALLLEKKLDLFEPSPLPVLFRASRRPQGAP